MTGVSAKGLQKTGVVQEEILRFRFLKRMVGEDFGFPSPEICHPNRSLESNRFEAGAVPCERCELGGKRGKLFRAFDWVGASRFEDFNHFAWLLSGNILHFCLLWFSGKSPTELLFF